MTYVATTFFHRMQNSIRHLLSFTLNGPCSVVMVFPISAVPELKWTQTAYISPQMHPYDRYFFDPALCVHALPRCE